MSGIRLLVSDVDNTLLGDDEGLKHFVRWYERVRDWLGIALASGRFYESVVESVETSALPEPCAIIGGVGTDIRLHPTGKPLDGWHQHIGVNWDSTRIRQILSQDHDLEPQPDELQSDYKVSYYLREASAGQLEELDRRIRAAGIEAGIVYSSQRDLDVLPARANKGLAARFLAERMGLHQDAVLVAGDSGNDLSLFQQGFRGVVVANAHRELQSLKHDDVYRATAGHAAGVLEGLQYWLRDEVPAVEHH